MSRYEKAIEKTLDKYHGNVDRDELNKYKDDLSEDQYSYLKLFCVKEASIRKMVEVLGGNKDQLKKTIYNFICEYRDLKTRKGMRH